ncbi:NMT1/THI5 like [Lachnospiraceae bacterium]|nr:NMT1/THI5 like [Lachnospiraceae bacterium]
MKKKLINLVMVSALAVSMLAGCGSAKETNVSAAESASESASVAESSETAQASAESKDELEVHIGDQPSFFILKVAEENGYFDEEFKDTGIKIVVDNFVNQGSAIVEAMNAGDVDLGVLGTMPLVTADANDSHFVAISSVNLSEDGFKLYAGAGTGITSVDQFKGKKIGVKFSSNEHEMLLTLIANAGLSDTDVEIVNLSAEDSLNSLISGDVDGAILKGDQLNAANDAGAVIVADNSESGIIENLLIGREEFVKEHPEVVTGVLKVLEKTKQWIDENPEETVDTFVKLTGTDKEVAKVSFESRTRSISIDEDKFVAPIQRTLDFLKSQGTIEDTLTIEDIVDTSYYENSGVTE